MERAQHWHTISACTFNTLETLSLHSMCVSADLGSGLNAIAHCFPAVHKRWHPKGIQYQACGRGHARLTVTLSTS